ncbi:hypothetical protein BH24ACI3_BH24ACI3_16260 [soil metagenome]
MSDEPLKPFDTIKEAVVADRELLEELFSNLYGSRIIYHERITILSEVIRYEITDGEFSLWHRPVKLLYANPVFDGMYERWKNLPHLEYGAALGIDDHPYIYQGGNLSMAYGLGVVWPGRELIEMVSNMSDDQIETDLGHIIWDRPRVH